MQNYIQCFVINYNGKTHSSVLAWRIPGTGDPGGLPSMGSHREGHDLAAAAEAVSPSNTQYYISPKSDI